MKIAIVIEKKIQDGGGFQQAINAIMSLQKSVEYEMVVFNNQKENNRALSDLNLNYVTYKFNSFQKLVNILMRNVSIYKVLSTFFKFNYFEKLMNKYSVDLIYFVNPSYSALDCVQIPYGLTVWDLCHLQHPEFEEVREHYEFEKREMLFSRALPKASFIIADSIIGKKLLMEKYRLDEKKILVQYFEPSYYVSHTNPEIEILNKYNIKPGYYFYPAQFWKHKNHMLILKAVRKLVIKKPDIKIVFSGENKGHYYLLSNWVKKYNLNENIIFLGFVPNEHLSTLYAFSKALIMPTFFGPSNIPPLEAFIFNKPILYSFPEYLEEVIPDYKYKYKIDLYDENILVDAILNIESIDTEKIINQYLTDQARIVDALKKIAYKIKNDI